MKKTEGRIRLKTEVSVNTSILKHIGVEAKYKLVIGIHNPVGGSRRSAHSGGLSGGEGS